MIDRAAFSLAAVGFVCIAIGSYIASQAPSDGQMGLVLPAWFLGGLCIFVSMALATVSDSTVTRVVVGGLLVLSIIAATCSYQAGSAYDRERLRRSAPRM